MNLEEQVRRAMAGWSRTESERQRLGEQTQMPSGWNLVAVHQMYEKFRDRVRSKKFSQREVEHDLNALIQWSQLALKSVKSNPVE